MAGTVIAAALITGLDSDLPGQVIATVTTPVFDSVTGRILLILGDARLLGTYDTPGCLRREPRHGGLEPTDPAERPVSRS